LFNKSLTESLQLLLDTKENVFDVFNNNAQINKLSTIVNLAAGEAKLFKFSNKTINKNYLLSTYNSAFYALETANNISLTLNTFNNGAVKSFTAENISIKNTQIKRGSIVRFKAYKNSNTIPENTQYAPVLRRDLEEETEGENMQITIFPNPTSNILNVDLTNIEETGTIEILNLQGILLDKKQFISHSKVIFDLSGFPSGLYLVIAKYGKNQKVFKIAKK